MTGIVIPAERLEAKREEREKQRRQNEALQGSILCQLEHEDDPQRPPALSAERRDPIR